jgi:hypothetical protein
LREELARRLRWQTLGAERIEFLSDEFDDEMALAVFFEQPPFQIPTYRDIVVLLQPLCAGDDTRVEGDDAMPADFLRRLPLAVLVGGARCDTWMPRLRTSILPATSNLISGALPSLPINGDAIFGMADHADSPEQISARHDGALLSLGPFCCGGLCSGAKRPSIRALRRLRSRTERTELQHARVIQLVRRRQSARKTVS